MRDYHCFININWNKGRRWLDVNQHMGSTVSLFFELFDDTKENHC